LATYWNLSSKSGDLEFCFLKSSEFGPFFPWKIPCISQDYIFQVEIWRKFASKRNSGSHSPSHMLMKVQRRNSSCIATTTAYGWIRLSLSKLWQIPCMISQRTVLVHSLCHFIQSRFVGLWPLPFTNLPTLGSFDWFWALVVGFEKQFVLQINRQNNTTLWLVLPVITDQLPIHTT